MPEKRLQKTREAYDPIISIRANAAYVEMLKAYIDKIQIIDAPNREIFIDAGHK